MIEIRIKYCENTKEKESVFLVLECGWRWFKKVVLEQVICELDLEE